MAASPPPAPQQEWTLAALIIGAGCWLVVKRSEDAYKMIKPLLMARLPGRHPSGPLKSDKVTIKIIDNDFLLPTEDSPTLQKGEVITVGWRTNIKEGLIPDIYYQVTAPYTRVGVGSTVLFTRTSATSLTLEGVRHAQVEEQFIIATINSNNIQDVCPLRDIVLVEVLEVCSVSVFDVIYRGKVINLGTGSEKKKSGRKCLQLKRGQEILFTSLKIIAVSEYFIVRASQISTVF